MAEIPGLMVRVLGAPEILAFGKPLLLNQLKSRALLFYLAATGGSHTRDHLANLLWGESGQSQAYHSLRSSLYHLRKILRVGRVDNALKTNGDLLSLEPESYQCDLIEFDRLSFSGEELELSQAVKLYRGPLLQGFSLTDSIEFDHWVQMESARIDHSYLGALSRLTALAEAREAWTMAVGCAQQMVQIDPLSETAQGQLIRLYLRQGEVGLALRQYRQFEQGLKQELGIAPSLETKALQEEILRQQRNLVNHNMVSSNYSKRRTHLLPFVGREDLMGQLSTIRAEAKAGHGTTVLIQGEGGIGKSRLLEEFASRSIAGSPPWMVLQAACSPFDDLLSHGPFIEALQNGAPDDLDSLLLESDSSVPDARGRFFWRFLQTIRSLAYSAPLMLVIEDLQWANSSTLNLFGFLSMRLQTLPVILVGTVQHAESIPALQRLITLGRRRHELHLFSLDPLSKEAILDLLRSSGVNPSSVGTLAEWLETKSTGNPFLLSEILAQLHAEEILRPAGDHWQLDTSRWLRWRTTFSLPETTHDLVGWRLANLSSEARNLLDLLAVAAQPVPDSLLRDLPGIWTNSFPALVEDLIARGLVLELPGKARLALPHHLLRETLLHRLSNLRRRTLHRQLAETMEIQYSADSGSGLRQIALHAVAGEDIDRARKYGLRLLADLPQEYAGAETVDFVQNLYDLLAPTASADEMVRITHVLGASHQSIGQLNDAAYWHRQTLSWAQQAGDSVAQVQVHFDMGELALMSNDYQTAAGTAQAGLDMVSVLDVTDPPLSMPLRVLSGRGYRLLGASLAMEGRDLAAAEEQLQKAVALHRQIQNQGDLCAVLFELGNVAAQRGELTRALDFYSESARVAEVGRIHYYLALAKNNFAYHCLLLGRVEAAELAVAQGIKIAESNSLLAALLHLYSTNGEISLHLNQWQAAEESFHSGLALAEELSNLERQAGYRGGLALAARGRKDLDTARQLLQEALAMLAGQGYWHLRTRLQLWLAETLVEQADYIGAREILEEAMQIARSQQRTLLVEQGERLQAQLLSLRESPAK